jgi:hypothetical protein
MATLYFSISLLLLAIGCIVIIGNWWVPIKYYVLKRRERSISCMPIVGGVLASFGLLLSPYSWLHEFFWIPLVVDIGCLPMILAYILLLLKGRVFL